MAVTIGAKKATEPTPPVPTIKKVTATVAATPHANVFQLQGIFLSFYLFSQWTSNNNNNNNNKAQPTYYVDT
jgi:hypothetical protein